MPSRLNCTFHLHEHHRVGDLAIRSGSSHERLPGMGTAMQAVT